MNCGRTFFFTLQNVLRKRPIFEASLRFRWLTVLWMFETFTATHNFRETNLCKLSSAKIGRVWDSKLVKNQFHIKSKEQKKFLISTLWNGVPPPLSYVSNLYRNVLHPNWKGKGVISWLDKKLHRTSYLSLRFKISFRNFWKYHLITLLLLDFYVVFMTKFYYLKC